MEFGEIVVKDTPGLCRCCLSEGCYKDLGTEYPWMEDTEVYAHMLLECFDVSISQHIEGPNGPNRLICEVCITRLRDACNFKKQVLYSEKKFIDMVGRGAFKPKVLMYPEQMKSETHEVPVEEAEIEYLEEEVDYDDIPLNELAEPSVSEDITVATLPVATKRGRPKKTVKTEKKKKLEDKVKPKSSKEQQMERKLKSLRKKQTTKILTAIVECSTIMPFRWAANKFLCFFCCRSFLDCSKLKEHTREEHFEAKLDNIIKDLVSDTVIKLDISNISCKLCPKPVTTLAEFLKHVSDKHDTKVDRVSCDRFFSFKLSEESLQCLECGQSFRFFGPLLIHMNKYHAKTNQFLCDTCGQGFIAKRNLRSHIRIHKNLNLYEENGVKADEKSKCPKCPEILDTKYKRRQHLALVHNDTTKKFQCDECTKLFFLKSRLVEHKLRVHVKEKYFTCEVCGFKVFNKDQLSKHKIKHNDVRPFQCEVCKKTFKRKKTLEFHRRIHTNDKRYACKDCDKAFVQFTSLKCHIRVHHSNIDKED